jgi:DNA primase large subunit
VSNLPILKSWGFLSPLTPLSSGLHSYEKPPLGEVTIEEFELFAIDRLRVLGEIESSWARNRPLDELKKVVVEQCGKYLPLNSNTAKDLDVDEQRRKDHIGHFVLRLAFCRS